MSGTIDPIDQLATWRANGRGAALATVVRTWGSSPRPAGSQLAISDSGEMVGSVSGGCVEGAVVDAALGLIGAGSRRMLDFGVTDESAWSVGLSCGGQLEVLVEDVGPTGGISGELLAALQEARAEKKLTALLTDLDRNTHALWVEGRVISVLDCANEPLTPALAVAVEEASRADRSGVVESGPNRMLVRVFSPPLRLFIVGAVHIAQSLANMANEAGYRVTLIDPREAWATSERFPRVEIDRRWPGPALGAAGIDRRTAVVTLSHDPKIDEPALGAALRSEAFYVGALGSRRTHQRRLDRLRELGFDDAALGRICGPVGLDIGAESPAEIAVSILAQITERLRVR